MRRLTITTDWLISVAVVRITRQVAPSHLSEKVCVLLPAVCTWVGSNQRAFALDRGPRVSLAEDRGQCSIDNLAHSLTEGVDDVDGKIAGCHTSSVNKCLSLGLYSQHS